MIIYEAGYSHQIDPDHYGYFTTIELAFEAIKKRGGWMVDEWTYKEYPYPDSKGTYWVYNNGENTSRYIREIYVKETNE